MENTPKGNQGSEEEIKLAQESLTKMESMSSDIRENSKRIMNRVALERHIPDEVLEEMLASFKIVKYPFHLDVTEVKVSGRKVCFVDLFGRDDSYITVDGVRVTDADKISKLLAKYKTILFHIDLYVNHLGKEAEERVREESRLAQEASLNVDDLL